MNCIQWFDWGLKRKFVGSVVTKVLDNSTVDLRHYPTLQISGVASIYKDGSPSGTKTFNVLCLKTKFEEFTGSYSKQNMMNYWGNKTMAGQEDTQNIGVMEKNTKIRDNSLAVITIFNLRDWDDHLVMKDYFKNNFKIDVDTLDKNVLKTQPYAAFVSFKRKLHYLYTWGEFISKNRNYFLDVSQDPNILIEK